MGRDTRRRERLLYRPIRRCGWCRTAESRILFSSALELRGEESRRPVTAAVILFVTTPDADKPNGQLAGVGLRDLPRLCPGCQQPTIVGHGQRKRQAHDQYNDWIWVRRGRCRPCRITFTILPNGTVPYGHYSLRYRQQAWTERCEHSASWEQSTPLTKSPIRVSDPATLRRWAQRRCLSLWSWLGSRTSAVWRFLNAPTLLAWDCPAAARSLLVRHISGELEGVG
jgi:hypothetical protein